MVQWLGLGAFTAMALGSNPGQGIKILQVKKKKKEIKRPPVMGLKKQTKTKKHMCMF